MSETTDEFLKRMHKEIRMVCKIADADLLRLEDLARRGAKIPDEPTEAMLRSCSHENPTLLGITWGEASAAYRAMIQTALKDTDNG